MQLPSGVLTLLVVFIANSNFFNKLTTGLSAKTFRLVTSPQYGDVTLCSVDQPYKVMSVSDIMLRMSGLMPGIPPHVICSQGCTGEQGCTGFNYKQDVGQCQLYNNIAANCMVQQACSHYSVGHQKHDFVLRMSLHRKRTILRLHISIAILYFRSCLCKLLEFLLR
jgi:hypothetical protein